MRYGARTSIAVFCLALFLCACNAIEAKRGVAARRVLGAIASAKTTDRATDSGTEPAPLLLAESRPDSIAPEPAPDPVRAMQAYHSSAIADARQKASAITISHSASGAVVQSEAIAAFTRKCDDRSKARASNPHLPPLSPELVVCPLTRASDPSSRT